MLMERSNSISSEDNQEELILHIRPGGNTRVEFFPVSFSEFIIDYVYNKEDRERAKRTNCRRIYCG